MTEKKTIFIKILSIYIKRVGLPYEVDPEVITRCLCKVAYEYGIDTMSSIWPQSPSALSRLMFECKEQFPFKVVRRKSGSRGRTFLFEHK